MNDTNTRFKVLLVYPNFMMVNLLPTNIGILTAVLRREGHEVDLFDTTFYRTAEKSIDEVRVDNLQLRKFNLGAVGIQYKNKPVVEAFLEKIRNFKPDLIGMTCVEDTWPQAKMLLAALPAGSRPRVLLGGIFPTFSPERALAEDFVDYICLGEGEEALVDTCVALKKGDEPRNIQNIWTKENGKIARQPMRPPLPLDEIPFGDFSLFEKERFFRPMQGKIYKMLPVETDRGCPYSCNFCNAPAIRELYKSSDSKYFRRRSLNNIREQILYYQKNYGLEYSYFNAETFLAISPKEFMAFSEMYSEFSHPFWCQTRVETIDLEKLKTLEKLNCNRISIGIEHGNEDFRTKIIGKTFKNTQLFDAFRNISQTSIPITVNNIIGFPDETRSLAFDTIEINRQISADSINAFYFVPYKGTRFYDMCLEKGYIAADTQTKSLAEGSCLDMPGFSSDEIKGLVRTFSLYVRFPKSKWPLVKRAESFDKEGNEIFLRLSEEFREKYFNA